MASLIQNGINSLESLFALNVFRIPQYQRAYSWVVDPHLESFLEDIRLQVKSQSNSQAKKYYLGTLLLHEEDVGSGKKQVNIVDGQQRLTTSVIFFAKALAMSETGIIDIKNENPRILKRTFIYDDDLGLQKFRTIEEDEPFFQSEILRIAAGGCNVDSPSSRRIKDAAEFFEKNIGVDEWADLLRVLRTSNLMIYSVARAEDATQIFELQNDRGKSLTSLESLKSYLMHSIYLHSKKGADDRLASIQSQFAKIYRIVEKLGDHRLAPDESQILFYHCIAFVDWRNSEYGDPKKLIKSIIKGLQDDEVVPFVETFVRSLLESFVTVEKLFYGLDDYQSFSELLLLDRVGSFWPLILKSWYYDSSKNKENFLNSCRLMEVFAFRGYAISSLRSDTGLSTLYIAAREFTGEYNFLLDKLASMGVEYNLEERFFTGLNNPDFYNVEKNDARYFLWRYENHLRNISGNIQPELSWRDFVEPKSYAAKFSVEHVAAVRNSLSDTIVKWSDEDEAKPFNKVALHRLGNLVIDSISPNASKGNADFSGKLESLSNKSIYLSQGELVNFVSDKETPIWDVEAIMVRHKHLVDFAQKTWNPGYLLDNWRKTK